jgi:hypothetical protein
MTDINYLKNIINKRTVAIFAHGRSIENLENSIETLVRDNSTIMNDVCFMGLGLFTIFEKYITRVINRNLDIVFDCATVPHARLDHYEILRLPRLYEFLNRPENNLWITTHGLIRDSVNAYMPELVINFENKILKVDDLFPTDEIPKWMDVPNSICLAISAAIAGEAKKIITFGLDGYVGDLSQGLDSYYKKEEHMKERMSALGKVEDHGINRDSYGFQNRFPILLNSYRELFNNNCPIYNCSPNSMYDTPKKIDYEQLSKIL